MAVRKRSSAMTTAEKTRFKAVMTQLINAPGNPNPYGKFVGIHAEDHMMHPFMGPLGIQRFLPWHRVYLLKLEEMGQAIDPLFFIPYWKWSRSWQGWRSMRAPGDGDVRTNHLNRRLEGHQPGWNCSICG